ncbi:transcriptional regulator, y4mF family [Serratia fonticola]|uniref:XRE family transcriptional regulator n=1 Tax=Serratia fonticola TaxID=47917 RepID=UPI0021786AA0|nr:helix-turn-helix transcriptional regulator [Serratia fonticola]CAI1820061.1 transcriptional regulator, y4mF family [Serratia fonticola]
MTLAERLKIAMKTAGLTQVALAEKVGVSQATIQKLTSGKAKTTNFLLPISRALEVNPDWLDSEIGPMRDPVASTPSPDSSYPPKHEGEDVEVWDDDTPLGDDEVYIPFYKSIELAAGAGCSTNEDHNGYKLRFSKSTLRRYGAEPSNVISFPVRGDSMSPVIPHKSTVTVDRGHTTITDGGIYAIEHDELFRLKMLYRLPGRRVSLRSYNKDDFPDEETDLENIKIIGRVINWSVMAW